MCCAVLRVRVAAKFDGQQLVRPVSSSCSPSAGNVGVEERNDGEKFKYRVRF